MFFTKDIEIKYPECDVNNQLKMSGAMRYMQQSAGDHMEYLQLPYNLLYEQHMVFLLTKLCIKVNRMPDAYETIRVGTAPVYTRGSRIFREFAIDSAEGERLVSTLSAWVLFDPHDRKLLRPNKFPYHMPFEEPALAELISDIALPDRGEVIPAAASSIRVAYSHLDCNNHVNNCIYGDFVCDLLPFDELRTRGLDTLVISFRNEARWGDTVDMTSAYLGERQYLIAGNHQRGTCFDALAVMK